MSFISRTIPVSGSRRVFLYVSLLMTVIALGTFGLVRVKTNPGLVAKIETSSVAPSAAITSQGNSSVTRIDSQHVTLRATGFEPAEFTRPAGRFLLSVDNRAETGELRFRLLRQNGSLERDLLAKNDKFRLRHVIELPPGHYSLVVVNHPEWVCRITIIAP